MKTILVPVDLSAATARVCDAACALAKLTGARLVLLHAVPPPSVLIGDYNALDALSVAQAMTAGEKYSRRRLQVLAARCAKRGVKVRAIQDTCPPVPRILEQAAALKAAHIVIGSHGHGAVYDLFAGSTTHGVLRKARCPVLVVPIRRGRKG